MWAAFGTIAIGVGPGGVHTSTAAASEPPQASLYRANCSGCHGRDGRANTPRGRRLEATDLTSDWNRDEARGIRIITNGRGNMPSFKKRLSTKQIKELFGYVSTF